MHNVYVRLLVYVMSTTLTWLAAFLAGWGVTVTEDVITIDIKTFVAGIVAAIGLSGGVFKQWGVK
jgi:hypothetical protein